MADTIKTGIQRPAEKQRGTNKEAPIVYGVRTPSSDFDKRPDQGGVTYVGPSKLGAGGKGLKSKGESQKKKGSSKSRG